MRVLASRAPRPAHATALAASSMDTYDSEHSSGRMPSLTLRPSRDDKSNMRHHLFNPFLGMTPNLLTWTPGSDASGKGPRILPSAHSLAKYPLASYPGRVEGEKWPGIYCLRMCKRFRYISAKL